MNDKVSKFAKKILWMVIISLGLYFVLWLAGNKIGGRQYLDSIDYQVTVDENGNMNVVEIWDIYINRTNTLFKTFQLNSSQYSGITDVKVKEITNGKNKDLTKIDQEMYHVTKDCYYGLKTSYNEFEIAWGVGLDNWFRTS